MLLAAAEAALAGVDGRNRAPEGLVVRTMPSRFPLELAWDADLLGARPPSRQRARAAGADGPRAGRQGRAPGPVTSACWTSPPPPAFCRQAAPRPPARGEGRMELSLARGRRWRARQRRSSTWTGGRGPRARLPPTHGSTWSGPCGGCWATRRLAATGTSRCWSCSSTAPCLWSTSPLWLSAGARRGAWAAVRQGAAPHARSGNRHMEFSSVAEEVSAVARLADLAVVHLPPAERAEGEAWVARPRRETARAE